MKRANCIGLSTDLKSLLVSSRLLSSYRYEELFRWARAALSAQGLDEQAVSKTLLRLSQPVEMEEVRREVGNKKEPAEGSVEEEEEKKEEPREESVEEPLTKRSCRYFL